MSSISRRSFLKGARRGHGHGRRCRQRRWTEGCRASPTPVEAAEVVGGSVADQIHIQYGADPTTR